MTSDIQHSFTTRFGNPSVGIKAPARINIIGEHTDYGLGMVMPAAINKYCSFFIGENPDNTKHQIYAYNAKAGLDCPTSIDSTFIKKYSGWEKYITATLYILSEAGYHTKAIQMAFGGDIPLGAGMSSSTALSCGFILGLSELNSWNIPRASIALLSQKTEHAVGAKGGLMDQYAILFSEKGQAMKLDCQSLTKTMIPLAMDGYQFTLINSNMPHDLASSSAYNDRRSIGEKAFMILKAKNATLSRLMDIESKDIDDLRSEFSYSDIQKIRYVYEENHRVEAAARDLINSDYESLGQKMSATHEGLRHQYAVSIPAMDFLVNCTKTNESIVGARMMGGGFGGSMLVLHKAVDMSATWNQIKRAFFEETGIHATVIPFDFASSVSRFL